MSTLDLSRLPAPIVLEPLDFEALYQEALTDFRALMGNNWSAPIESEPVVKLLEKRAYDKMMERARINDAAKALLLAFARGSDVDHLAANYNVKRLTVVEADPAAVPPIEAQYESDDSLVERTLLAFEGMSAGQLTVTSYDTATVIEYEGGTLTIHNVAKDSIDPDDFVFF